MLYQPTKPTVKNFRTNTVGRDFVVGDMHGCYKDFSNKLKEISFDTEKDRMFSVGDLVDRGPDSMGCLRLIEKPWFHSVKGNHEDMMVGALLEEDDNQYYGWLNNGGLWARDCVETEEELIEWAKKARDLPIVINVACGEHMIGICHAQPPKSYDWKYIENPASEVVMLWGRTRVTMHHKHVIKNIDWTFHGHTPVSKVAHLGNTTFLDTGCVFDEKYPLTVLEFSDKGVLNSQFIMRKSNEDAN